MRNYEMKKTYTILLVLVLVGCGSNRPGLVDEGDDASLQEADGGSVKVLWPLAGAGGLGAPGDEDGGVEGVEDAEPPWPEDDSGGAAGDSGGQEPDSGADPADAGQDSATPAPDAGLEPLSTCEPCTRDSDCGEGLLCWYETAHPSRTETFCQPWVERRGTEIPCSGRADGFTAYVDRPEPYIYTCRPMGGCAAWSITNGGS